MSGQLENYSSYISKTNEGSPLLHTLHGLLQMGILESIMEQEPSFTFESLLCNNNICDLGQGTLLGSHF